MSAIISPELAAQLADQLSNPQHCFLKVGPSLFIHHPDPKAPQPFDGQPVRFTRMAALAMMEQMPGAKMVPCD